MSIRVLIVDDHPMFRDGLRHLLADPAFEVAGEAADGEEALAVLRRHPADVVIMDLHMPRMDGITATARIRAAFPDTHVLVLSTYDTDADVVPAMAAGAVGYLLKDVPREQLLDAVRAAAAGRSALSPTVADRVVGHLHTPALKPREIELLRLVAAGSTNKEAAAALFVSEATVKAYLLRIYDRLGARDRASAVAEAYRRGLLR